MKLFVKACHYAIHNAGQPQETWARAFIMAGYSQTPSLRSPSPQAA